MTVLAVIMALICLGSSAYAYYFRSDKEPGKPVNECGYCERKFYDSDNKKSIAKSGLCKNCHNNYKDLEWVLDE